MPSPGSTLHLGAALHSEQQLLVQAVCSACTQLLLQNTRCEQGGCPRKEERFSCLVCVCWEAALFSHSFCSFSLIIWKPDLWVHSFNSVYMILTYYFNLCCCWGNLTSKDHSLCSVTPNSSRKHYLVYSAAWRGLWFWGFFGLFVFLVDLGFLQYLGCCWVVCFFSLGVSRRPLWLGWGLCGFAWVELLAWTTYFSFSLGWKKSEKPGKAFHLQLVGLDF